MRTQTFYHPDLGRFTSDRADLSDLAGEYYEVAKSSMAVRAELAKTTLPGCPCDTCRAYRSFLPNDVSEATVSPPAPEKTEAERAWDYLVLAAEASRYNT